MKWGIVLSVTAAMICIVWFEWPKMKQHPTKDKVAFAVLVLIAWVLAMFDLRNMPGPTSWISSLFKPFTKWMQ